MTKMINLLIWAGAFILVLWAFSKGGAVFLISEDFKNQSKDDSKKDDWTFSAAFVSQINLEQDLWQADPNFDPKTVHYTGAMSASESDQFSYLESHHHRRPRYNITNSSQIPDQFDARQAWPNCSSIRLIRNQGHCGSCWAVSVASALSDRVCIVSGGGSGSSDVQLSASDLACCSECGHDSLCSGGHPGRAWNYFVKAGLVTGNDPSSVQSSQMMGCKPYLLDSEQNLLETSVCTRYCSNENYTKEYSEDKYWGNSSYRVPTNDLAQIQMEIMTHGPVTAGIKIYNDIHVYKSGVYHHLESTGSNYSLHSIRVIGWGVEKETPYWLFANSWGTRWGEMGFGKMRRGQNECDIETEIYAGIPLKPDK